MKKIIIPVFTLMALGVSAQTYIDDALDLSNETIEGTARYRAMGGAMGALGSDIGAAINSNPAAGAVAVRSDATATLGVNTSKWEDGNFSDSKSKFLFNEIGANLIFDNEESDWKRFALTFGYNRLNLKDRDIQVAPLADYTYEDVYQYTENGTQKQYTGLFTYDGETAYIDGYTDKVALNFSGNYKDRLFIGAGLNFYGSEKQMDQTIDRTNKSEVMFNPYNNLQDQTATGFSLAVGVIGKISEEVRVGVSYQSPIWWNVEEEFYRYEWLFNADGSKNQGNDAGGYFEQYDVRTPGKLTGSIGVVLAKNLALNGDVIFKDYKNVNFDNLPSYDDATQNDNAEALLRNTMEYRIGGEYRIEEFKLRAGYRYKENPYKDLDTNTSTYSVGAGYNFGNFYLDASYDYTDGSNVYYLSNRAVPLLVKHDIENSNVMVTLGYKF